MTLIVRDRQRHVRLMIVLFIAVVTTVIVSCDNEPDGESAELVEMRKSLAGELRDNRLYSAAIEEYRRILDNSTIDQPTRASINYLIARIYFEDLQEYEQAAAYYMRARALDPDGSFVDEASRKLVAALEKMGRTLDARRQLSSLTDVDAVQPKKGDVQVARVGGVPIWRSQIENEIQSLPPEMQQQFGTVAARVQFMHSYVAQELLYRAAVREDYGNDPEIKRRQHQLYRKLLTDQYVVDKVMPNVQVDTSDVHNYYLVHRTDRYQSAPYDSVRATVFLDYQREKMGQAFGEYIDRLALVERVEFFDQQMR